MSIFGRSLLVDSDEECDDDDDVRSGNAPVSSKYCIARSRSNDVIRKSNCRVSNGMINGQLWVNSVSQRGISPVIIINGSVITTKSS